MPPRGAAGGGDGDCGGGGGGGGGGGEGGGGEGGEGGSGSGSGDGSPSLHLTFSTYQRHTWRALLADDAVPLSLRARAALAALRRAAPADDADDADDADPTACGGAVLRGAALLDDLPLDLLRTHCAGQPHAGWQRCARQPTLTPTLTLTLNQTLTQTLTLTLARCARQLVPPRAPFWLSRELQRDAVLGAALDALALRYLQHSLPPLGTTREASNAAVAPGGAGGAGGGGGAGGAGGSADAADAAAPVDDATRLRMCAPHCARLVDSSGGGGDLGSWERGEGPTPALALHTNVGNGRAFAEPPSPAFEVLPALARSVLQLLQAGVAGLRAGGLAAAGSADADVRADLFDLLDLLVEHRVLVRL